MTDTKLIQIDLPDPVEPGDYVDCSYKHSNDDFEIINSDFSVEDLIQKQVPNDYEIVNYRLRKANKIKYYIAVEIREKEKLTKEDIKKVLLGLWLPTIIDCSSNQRAYELAISVPQLKNANQKDIKEIVDNLRMFTRSGD